MPISKEHFRPEIFNLSSRYVLIIANLNHPICPERPCILISIYLECTIERIDTD